MEKAKKMKIFLSIVLIFFILVPAVYYISVDRLRVDEEVKGERDISGVPYIINIAPITAYVGEEYLYVPSLVDIDNLSADLVLELVESPSWLFLEDGIIRGVPPYDSEGAYEFTLRVSDGENSSVRKSYILVEGLDEE